MDMEVYNDNLNRLITDQEVEFEKKCMECVHNRISGLGVQFCAWYKKKIIATKNGNADMFCLTAGYIENFNCGGFSQKE
jgi:hypothetical protein